MRCLPRSADICDHDIMLKTGIRFDGLAAALAWTAHIRSHFFEEPGDMNACQSLRRVISTCLGVHLPSLFGLLIQGT